MAKYRYGIAFGAGSLAYIFLLYRFRPLSDRPDPDLLFVAVMTIVGFLVTIGATTGRYRTVGLALLGICAVHLLVVIADVRQNPTSHNLGPIEFIVLCVFALPAYIGAAISHIVDSVRKRSGH